MSIIQHSKEIIIRDLNQLKIEIENTPTELLWKIEPGIINSIGNLCYHICGNLNHFIGNKLGGSDYKRDIETEFNCKDLTKIQLIDIIQDTMKVVDNSLTLMDENKLNDEMPDPPTQHKGKSIGFFLIQICCHLSRHRGQLNYLVRILSAKNDF